MSVFASSGVYRRSSAVAAADLYRNDTRYSSHSSSDEDNEDDETLMINTSVSFAETLRARLLGVAKGKGRAEDDARLITTAPGMVGAGETETEGEDAVSRSYLSWYYPILVHSTFLLNASCSYLRSVLTFCV